jgi:Xaa-Pro aminopeptidase
MRYIQLPKEMYSSHRERFAKELKPGGLAIFNSNDIYPSGADGTLPFKQHSDIFYLSGVDQEESVLLIFPDSFHAHHREILFLRETNDQIAIWEGAKLSKDQAYEVSGIKTVYWLSDFEKILHGLLAEAQCIYLNNTEHTRASIEVETREKRFSKWFREKYPHYQIERSNPILHRIRSVKSSFEVEQMQRACNITKAGFERVLKFMKPGVMEYEIEAEFAHEFLRRGSRGFAYTPILASGFNACVLHYISNDAACHGGDVILMDVGAEYGNYASDMTRCAPVNGRFSPRQKAVYNAVLRVMKGAMSLIRPGVLMHEYHKQVGDLMTKELVDLGLLTMADVASQDPKWPAYKKYFMHGTSHFLGIDVHDYGDWTLPVQEGYIFTVEPGIYIREENLGIRLENNILIQKEGFLDLMAEIPIEADHIEELMNS